MKLIDKDALVAGIKTHIEGTEISQKAGVIKKRDANKKISLLKSVLSLIDTLEVKDDNLLTEKKIEKELAEAYISIFDKKFGNKLPKLKGKRLADFKNFINTCEQTFHIKYFDYHATQGKLFEKLALLWAVWGKEHLNLEGKEVELEKDVRQIISLYYEGIKYYEDVIRKERDENGGSDLAIKIMDGVVDARELSIQYVIDKLKAQKGE